MHLPRLAEHPRASSLRSFAFALGAMFLLSHMTGCKVAGWVAHGIVGDDDGKVEVVSEYQGLKGKKVAVLVSADERTLYWHPKAPLNTCTAISSALSQSVAGIELVRPSEVMAFQAKSPYWVAVPYGELAKELKVDRLVVVSLARYSVHEPGNKELWQGNMAGRVSVAEADGKDPDNFVYAKTIAVKFPEDRPMGVVNANEETIELGMLKLFSARVGKLLSDKKPED